VTNVYIDDDSCHDRASRFSFGLRRSIGQLETSTPTLAVELRLPVRVRRRGKQKSAARAWSGDKAGANAAATAGFCSPREGAPRIPAQLNARHLNPAGL
jgi:hypothetical protein